MIRTMMAMLALGGFVAMTLAACEVDVDDRADRLTEYIR